MRPFCLYYVWASVLLIHSVLAISFTDRKIASKWYVMKGNVGDGVPENTDNSIKYFHTLSQSGYDVNDDRLLGIPLAAMVGTSKVDFAAQKAIPDMLRQSHDIVTPAHLLTPNSRLGLVVIIDSNTPCVTAISSMLASQFHYNILVGASNHAADSLQKYVIPSDTYSTISMIQTVLQSVRVKSMNIQAYQSNIDRLYTCEDPQLTALCTKVLSSTAPSFVNSVIELANVVNSPSVHNVDSPHFAILRVASNNETEIREMATETQRQLAAQANRRNAPVLGLFVVNNRDYPQCTFNLQSVLEVQADHQKKRGLVEKRDSNSSTPSQPSVNDISITFNLLLWTGILFALLIAFGIAAVCYAFPDKNKYPLLYRPTIADIVAQNTPK